MRDCQLSVVYKFGGSSVASAQRMLEVADIVCSFPEHAPIVVLSAMGKVSDKDCDRSLASLSKKSVCTQGQLLSSVLALELGVVCFTVEVHAQYIAIQHAQAINQRCQ